VLAAPASPPAGLGLGAKSVTVGLNTKGAAPTASDFLPPSFAPAPLAGRGSGAFGASARTMTGALVTGASDTEVEPSTVLAALLLAAAAGGVPVGGVAGTDGGAGAAPSPISLRCRASLAALAWPGAGTAGSPAAGGAPASDVAQESDMAS